MSKIKHLQPVVLILIGLAFALGASALTPLTDIRGQVQTTPTPVVITPVVTLLPKAEIRLIPGNTNLILLLGAFLVVIIVVAILWHRRDWER